MLIDFGIFYKLVYIKLSCKSFHNYDLSKSFVSKALLWRFDFRLKRMIASGFVEHMFGQHMAKDKTTFLYQHTINRRKRLTILWEAKEKPKFIEPEFSSDGSSSLYWLTFLAFAMKESVFDEWIPDKYNGGNGMNRVNGCAWMYGRYVGTKIIWRMWIYKRLKQAIDWISVWISERKG